MSTFAAWRRSRAAAVALFNITFTFGLVSCGPSKPAEDASSAPKPAEEVPKWDSSSETRETAATPPKPSSTSAPTTPSPAATQRRSDVYDKEETEVVLNRASRQVKANCGQAKDEDGNAKGPWGKTSITINLGHTGHTRGVTIPPPFDGKPTGKCAVQAFSNLTFPPWGGADMSVEWPVEIDQPKK
jgi:hypothetical protein